MSLLSALCVASLLACTPESRSQAATQEPPRMWAFELNILEGDKPDEYIAYPNDVLPSLQLHAEKLTMSVQSGDDLNRHRGLSLDPTIRLPANFGAMNIRWAGFRFDYDSLPSGMYTLSANAEPGFATRTDGSRETLDVTRARVLTIYVPPRPERMPAPGIGERFIFLTNFGYNEQHSPAVVDERGAPLQLYQVAARPLTFTRTVSISSGESGVRFERSGGNGSTVTFLGFSDPRDVPGLYPLVEDQASKRMNLEYAGRPVWTRGTPTEYCDVYCGFAPPNAEFFVVGVYRTRGYAEDMAIRQAGGRNLVQPTSFRALDPLVVALRDRGGRGPRPRSMPLPDAGPNAYATFSDDWDLERAYSLVSMDQAHPEWPVSVRDAIVLEKPKLGMTRDMITWMLGYPSTYGTIAKMNSLDTWNFDGPPSTDMNFNFTFDFQNDRVVKCFPECTSHI